jgi:hypothetical protein
MLWFAAVGKVATGKTDMRDHQNHQYYCRKTCLILDAAKKQHGRGNKWLLLVVIVSQARSLPGYPTHTYMAPRVPWDLWSHMHAILILLEKHPIPKRVPTCIQWVRQCKHQYVLAWA